MYVYTTLIYGDWLGGLCCLAFRSLLLIISRLLRSPSLAGFVFICVYLSACLSVYSSLCFG